MKTIEEKAKAYDIIIEKANKMHSENCEACKACIEELIPELAKSEDEKIRHYLMNFVKLNDGVNLPPDDAKKALAWLEKQAEQKPNPVLDIEIPFGAKDSELQEATYYIPKGFHAEIDDDKVVIKQGEQKFEMKTAEESLCIDSDTYNKIVDECIFGEQKPEENKGNIGGISPNSAWSDEDEENFCSVYLDVKSARQNTVNSLSGDLKEQEQKRMDEVISWLESLKGRVQPKQEWTEEEIEPIISDYLCGREHYGGMIGRLCHLKPKQKQTEWSENDKAFLDDILCKLEHDLILNKDEKDWLKSLRPQNRWKPSELQLGCLSDAIEYYNSLGYPASKLKELYEQLKKL